MSWFKNLNAQAQINAAESSVQSIAREKDIEIERLRNEANIARINSTSASTSASNSASRRAKRAADEAQEELAVVRRELIIAKNEMQELATDNQTLKRINLELGHRIGLSESEILESFSKIRQEVKAELGLTPIPVPDLKEKVEFSIPPFDPTQQFAKDPITGGFTFGLTKEK